MAGPHRVLMLTVALLTSLGNAAAPTGPASADEAVNTGPVRLVDTRSLSTATNIDGSLFRDRPVHDGETIRIEVGPDPVVLNTVAVLSTGAGFATVYPCAEGRPTASNLNFVPGQILANATIASPDQHGNVCIYFNVVGAVGQPNMVDVVVDRYSTIDGDDFDGFRPIRLYDSRPGSGTGGDGIRYAQSVKVIHVGVSNQPVVLNVTSTGPLAPGIFTVYPCGVATPTTSNLNYEPFETRAALVAVKANQDGDVCVYTAAATHLVVDWMGTFTAGGSHDFFMPTRLIDSRDQFGAPHGRYFVVDLTNYRSQSGQLVRAKGRAAVLNVTAVAPFDHGFVTVYPCGDGGVPNTSLVNYPLGRFATPNAVIVQPDGSDRVCFFSEARAHLVVDLFGFVETNERWQRSTTRPATPHPDMSTLVCGEQSDGHRVTAQWRARHGLPALSYDPDLYPGALWWARHLATHREFRHSTQGEIAAAGYPRRYGEVVNMEPSVSNYEGSPPHYAILTDGRYTHAAFAFCRVDWTDGSMRRIGVGWLMWYSRSRAAILS